MAWSDTPVTDIANACLQSYKESKTVVLVVGQDFGNKRVWKTVDETYSATGMTQRAAKLTADHFAGEPGYFAEARKVYASDGWEVSITHHETTCERSQSVET